ncbi:HAD family hydrolase [Cryobacterium melibiosiphilum]|uniref:HAD family hydrolase n=1 Tax=Cryobacterium melibiosiphilum TaxID=995039 RepID=A0A3A5ME72_9MICO|nr:HAD family hydrolase [Cryobacterium melibiosiphilum]RJT87752.1 HAD family hydrolase [Cryobacterium melibiosiphilum]
MSAVQVVLFDLDDTLFAHRAAVSDGILMHLDAVDGAYEALSRPDSAALWDALEEEHYHSYLAGRLDFHGQRRARARDFATAHGVALDDAAATTWFDDYFLQYRASWRLHTDALPCLDELARRLPGVRFGLITNGDPVFQGDKIRRVGLEGRFEHVIASGSLGFTKPDARIFAHACALSGVAADAAVYVGDRLRTDAIGAAAAGLTGIWLDREGASAAAAAAVPEADRAEAARLGVLRIQTLAELPPLLA